MLDDYHALVRDGRVHVVEQGGVVRGLLVLREQPDALLLDNVAVSPLAQGMGLGRILLAFAEAVARASGYQTIKLYTNEAMSENRLLYARNGYIETHRAVERGLRRVFMTKKLD
ncbi:MAG: GNAT family N-acetyltransferase [Acetobacteraceae bacterium]|nr:GNAT family N-acetyltransferase [Acetobacteraceae bacterium]